MKKLLLMFSFFMATASFAADNSVSKELNCKSNVNNNLTLELVSLKVEEALGCSQHTTSIVVTNRDGSTTRTTTTTIECDTPGELAELHQILRAIGMGI